MSDQMSSNSHCKYKIRGGIVKKLTPRAKFIATADEKRIKQLLWDVAEQASNHDPEHHEWLTDISKCLNKDLPKIDNRLDIIERQLERIGAPQYRKVRKGFYAEIVRGPKSAKALKD